MKHLHRAFIPPRAWMGLLVAAACGSAAGATDAAGPPPSAQPWPGPARPLEPDRLDRLRGGFQGADGLVLSFGIERQVYVNGTLVSSTQFALQGAGSAAGMLAPPALGTLVQNALNDQHIRTLTIINADANSLDVLRSWALQLSIRDAVAGAVRR